MPKTKKTDKPIEEVKEIKKEKIEKPVHFEKYLLLNKYNKMQIAAIGSKIKKTDLKTAKEWDEFCNKIINMRLR